MYINPFLAGVITTLMVEMTLLLLTAMYLGGKRK